MSQRFLNPGIQRWRRVFIASSCVVLSSCSGPDPAESTPLSINTFLQSNQSSGFSKALAPIVFDFPTDHGAHPAYKYEWWYITGNLETAGKRRFGFQFTLFRNALKAGTGTSLSRWSANQIYLAHIALTDASRKRFYSDERFSRGALGLAGVRHDPLKAWLEDWHIEAAAGADCATCFEIRLSAGNDEFGLDLLLKNLKPLVLHGDAGLSRKSDTPGNASYYYSYTRLQTRGEISIGGEDHEVSGDGWLDHEWSTSALEDTQAGWDWFSIQLSDNTELMLFQLRHHHDPRRNYFSGTFVDRQANTHQLSTGSFTIETTDTWSSPESGAAYPTGWDIKIPDLDIELALTPLMEAQEQNQSFRYWEGAVDARGFRSGHKLSGHGYVELTGYD